MKFTRSIRTEYVMSPDEERVIVRFLRGELAAREAGKQLGVSHQQAINMLSTVCRQWVKSGKLILKSRVKARNGK